MTATMSQRINSPTRTPDIFDLPQRRRGSTAADRLEFACLFAQREFDRKALHRRGAVEAVAVSRMLENVFGVLGLGDRAAVAEDERVRLDRQRRRRPGVDQF